MEKVSGEDKVPPRLVKMASNFLFESITHIINAAVDTDTFPDRAKHIYLINDLFLFIKKASRHNYADNSTLCRFATSIDDLIEILTDESQKTIDWLKLNQLIVVNPKKFQAMFISKKFKCLTVELETSNK